MRIYIKHYRSIPAARFVMIRNIRHTLPNGAESPLFLDLCCDCRPNALTVMTPTRTTEPYPYWRISPGPDGYLWREQKLNECIALGWSDIKNAKSMTKEKLRAQGAGQLYTFIHDVQIGDKVVASASGRGVYALGTVVRDYLFDQLLEYKHSRKVRWETTFWHPVDIDDLDLSAPLYNKFHGRGSGTIKNLDPDEWNCLCENLNKVSTPFRNLGMWGGLIQSPEYENEVIILFSQMLQHLHMRIIGFGTRFPDAIVERKVKRGKWKRLNVEFERYAQGFKRDHIGACKDKDCHTIVCWENDWDDAPKEFEIIELKKELENIL